MEAVKSLLKPKPTPQQQLREWQRRLRNEGRNIDRQIRGWGFILPFSLGSICPSIQRWCWWLNPELAQMCRGRRRRWRSPSGRPPSATTSDRPRYPYASIHSIRFHLLAVCWCAFVLGFGQALAKEVVRSRKAVNRLYENKAQLNSISMHLGEIVGNESPLIYYISSHTPIVLMPNCLRIQSPILQCACWKLAYQQSPCWYKLGEYY